MRKPMMFVALCSAVASLSLAAWAADMPKMEMPKGADKAMSAARDGSAKIAAVAKPAIGAEAPNFTLTDSKGNKVSLSDYKGKIVVLEWVNVDCPIDDRVVREKRISKVYDKYKDKSTWLAIDSTAAHKQADYDKTLDKWKLEYPLLNDATGAVGHLYAATNTPHFFIINTDGKLAYMGAIDNDPQGSKGASEATNYVDQALDALTSGKSVPTAETKAYGCSVKYEKPGLPSGGMDPKLQASSKSVSPEEQAFLDGVRKGTREKYVREGKTVEQADKDVDEAIQRMNSAIQK